MRVAATPGIRLLLAVLGALLSAAGATWLLTAQPAVPAADRVVAIATRTDTVALTPTDRIEEPDFLDTWAEMDAFFVRQGLLAARLQRDGTAVARDESGTRIWRTVQGGRRPLRDLPFAFWFQIVVGCIAVAVGAWIWALRPTDAAARAFAVTGVGVLLSSHAAAVYSTRAVALPTGVFRLLSATNHLGATLFGVALCTLLLHHPRPLPARRWVPVLGVIALLWWASDILRLAPNPNIGTRLPLVLELLGAIALAVVQWRRTAQTPSERALLRWLGMSVLVGPGLFIGVLVVAAAVGTAPIPQAYGMGFFLLTYVGMAVGLRRYRLFALDAWALRILFWGTVAALFITLDLVLLRFAGGATARSFVVVAMLALSTLPVRQWVWTHVLHRPALDLGTMVDQTIAISYAATTAERASRWRAYLATLFDPLAMDVAPASTVVDAPQASDDGERLVVPAVTDTPTLVLTHAGGGRRLFGPTDVQLAERVVALLHQVDASRATYEAGVSRERERIARDLHDTVSSPLLSGLARVRGAVPAGGPFDPTTVQREITRALEAMRDVVRGAAEPAPLDDVIADVRFECVTRLHQAGVVVDWPLATLGARMLTGDERTALQAFFREATSNVLRHAGAKTVTVRIAHPIPSDAPWVDISFADDGCGLPTPVPSTGHGLTNLLTRAAALGGEASFTSAPSGTGTSIRLRVPAVRERPVA